MRASVARTADSIKTGKEPFHLAGFAIRAGDSVFRSTTENQFFKFGFAVQTLVFIYGHGNLVILSNDDGINNSVRSK